MAQTVTKPGMARGPVTGTAVRSRKRKPFLLDLYGTAVGKKYAMAITGLGLLGFVLVHMIGNLMYQSPNEYNEYAEQLRTLGGHLVPREGVLWVLRLGLISAVTLHLHAAITLTVMNRQSRPQGYQAPRNYSAANFASRSMRATGIIVLLFVVFHLLDLTWGVFLGDDYIHGDVYNNVVRSLSSAPVAIVYILANVALAVHLYHGAWSLFQSLGWNNPKFNQARRMFATAVAGIILVGNLSFPIMNLAGVVSQETRETPCHDGSTTCLGENQ